MTKFYKKAMILLISSLIGLTSMQAQAPKFTMTTAKTVGQSFEFTLNFGPMVMVDWGDGTPVEYPSVGKPIVGEVKGSTITVSGFDISMIDCSDQELTALSVNEILTLQTLICPINKLTELSIGSNDQLIKLNCSYNELTNLSITSSISKLKELNFAHNKIASSPILLFSKMLEVLICNNNQLPALTLISNLSIKTLWCHSNKITTLNLSKNPLLESLICYDNEIKTLNLTGLSALKQVWCNDNKIATLNLLSNSALNYVSTDNNKLSSFTVPSEMNIKNLYVNNNALGFGGLHSGSAITSYNYQGQYLLILPTTSLIELNKELDLSSELTTLDGISTQAVFNWYGDGKKLTAGTDYTEEAGKFVFLKAFDKAHCEITSIVFPNIEKLMTNEIGVASTTGLEENTTQSLKLFAQNGRLTIKVPTEQSINIYNLMGRLVKSYDSVIGSIEVDLPRGTYIVNKIKVII